MPLITVCRRGLLKFQTRAHLITPSAANRHEVSAPPDDDLQDQLITAERKALEAKAKFEIRNRISHNVLIMDPVLKAVHGGQQHTTEK